MFNGGNADFSMPVMPAYGNANNGMGGWGDGGWWILIVLLALFGGYGNGFGGWGGNGAGLNGALTRGELCQDFNFNNLDSAVRSVQSGLCDGFYAVNTSLLNGFNGVDNAICTLGYQNAQLINGVQMQVANEFRGTDNAICTLGYQVQQGQNALSTQIADCCCRTQSNLKDIQFQNAQDTCATTNAIAQAARDIVDNQNLNYRALHDEIVANRIEDKNAIIAAQNQQIFQYQLAASQASQTTDIKNGILTELRNCPVGTYPVPNPNCCYGANITFGNPYNGYGYNGYNNGCGCNSGCCGCNA